MSLIDFAGSHGVRQRVHLGNTRLRLQGLELLESFNSASHQDLLPDVLDALIDRPLKVIALNDKSDLQVRYDLFERLNTGGIRLTDHEIREAVFPGEFVELLNSLATSADFRRVALLPTPREKDGTRQDFALRFFAYLNTYQNFDHSVRDFLLD